LNLKGSIMTPSRMLHDPEVQARHRSAPESAGIKLTCTTEQIEVDVPVPLAVHQAVTRNFWGLLKTSLRLAVY
jgi:hypothetical protein